MIAQHGIVRLVLDGIRRRADRHEFAHASPRLGRDRVGAEQTQLVDFVNREQCVRGAEALTEGGGERFLPAGVRIEERHARFAGRRQAEQAEQRITVLDLLLVASLDMREAVIGADDDSGLARKARCDRFDVVLDHPQRLADGLRV